MVISVIVALVGELIGAGLENAPPAAVLLIWLVYFAGAVFVVSRLRNRWIRQSWQLKARSAEEELARAGAKRPVFYLRSFNLDERLDKPSLFERLMGSIPLANSEQVLTRQLRKIGPVIAIGRPGEKLPALGAARFYVSEDLWHQKVGDVVKVSQLVLWATGITPGLRWEIGHLIENLPPEKLVLWAHPHLLKMTATEREEEWTKFLAALGDIFPKPLPATLGDARFICFAADWQPIPIAPRWWGPVRAMSSLFNPMNSALTEVRKIKQGKAEVNQAVYRAEAPATKESSLAALIGVAGPEIAWGRVAAFFFATFISWNSAFLAPVLIRTVSDMLDGRFDTLPRVFERYFQGASSSHLISLQLMLAILMTVCTCVAFRYIHDWKTAAVGAAASYAVLFELIQVAQNPESTQFHFGGVLATFLFQLGFVAGLAIAIPRFSPVAKAIFVGAFFGDLAAWVLMIIVGGILSERMVTLTSPVYYAIEEVIFALTFWLALRLQKSAPKQATTG